MYRPLWISDQPLMLARATALKGQQDNLYSYCFEFVRCAPKTREIIWQGIRKPDTEPDGPEFVFDPNVPPGEIHLEIDFYVRCAPSRVAL